jgi:hypothetical protein
MSDFISETLLSHAKIVDYKGQVLVHSVEVLKFLTHFVCLLIKSLDFYFTRSNITLKLFNLVIKDELEFF